MKGRPPSVRLAVYAILIPGILGCPVPEADVPDAEATREAADEGDRQVRIVEGERSGGEFPDLGLRILSPEEAEVLPAGEVTARFVLNGFRLKEHTPGVGGRGIAVTEDGQHLHVIVDDRPYEAIYDISEPVSLGELEPGAHLLRAFPSRSWHESLKVEGAFAATWFSVEEEAGPPAELGAPLLTYSRPKGEYRGTDADSVMVDFYLSNVDLADGYAVRLTVNDTVVHRITDWAPHYIIGLPSGEHRVRLELLDPEGARVPGRFNVSEGDITVVRDEGDE